MKLKSEDRAPDFNVQDISGKTIKLSDYKGKKILLSFYRYAACPLCNLRVSQIIARYPIYKAKGIVILSFFESSNSEIKKNVGKQSAPFSIIGDKDKKIYKLYKVKSSFWGLIRFMFHPWAFFRAISKGFFVGKIDADPALLPADFLINPDLTINTAYYAKDIGGHISFKQIEGFLSPLT